MGGLVSIIEPGSIAEHLGWKLGDEVVSINGHVLRDVIDYRFYSADEDLLVVVKSGTNTLDHRVCKGVDTSLGADFDDPLFDGIHTCGGRCTFCFVEQLPKGLRKSLYVKDDDYRLSFIDGNYVTLTNVTDTDVDRIIEQGLSPLYISVHTTDPDLRSRLLGRKAPDILGQLDSLASGRIKLHTQIVICPGINDGNVLVKTIEDIALRYPAVQSIAVVPVGLTTHRAGLANLKSVGCDEAEAALGTVARFQKKFLNDVGTRLVWAADELYLKAGRSVPGNSHYEDYSQIENGVGLVRLFKQAEPSARRLLGTGLSRTVIATAITGMSAHPVLAGWANSIRAYGASLSMIPVKNTVLGESVTVTGLICGSDVIAQLAGLDLGETLFVPSVALRDGFFLDDVSIDDVSRSLGILVEVVDPDPKSLARSLVRMAGGDGNETT